LLSDKVDLFVIKLCNMAVAVPAEMVGKLVQAAVVTQEFSLELLHLLFQAQAAELLRVQVQTERPVAAAAQIKMVAKQVLPQLPAAVELTLRVALVQLETQVVLHLDRFLAMVLICKVAHHVIKLMLKVAGVAAVVTTAVAVVHIKLQAEDQKTVVVAVARATLI
jgi:hypothetical protein